MYIILCDSSVVTHLTAHDRFLQVLVYKYHEFSAEATECGHAQWIEELYACTGHEFTRKLEVEPYSDMKFN